MITCVYIDTSCARGEARARHSARRRNNRVNSKAEARTKVKTAAAVTAVLSKHCATLLRIPVSVLVGGVHVYFSATAKS